MDLILNIPLFPCVSVGRDDTPRFPAKGMKYVMHYHNTPESFATLLQTSIPDIAVSEDSEYYIFVNTGKGPNVYPVTAKNIEKPVAILQ